MPHAKGMLLKVTPNTLHLVRELEIEIDDFSMLNDMWMFLFNGKATYYFYNKNGKWEGTANGEEYRYDNVISLLISIDRDVAGLEHIDAILTLSETEEWLKKVLTENPELPNTVIQLTPAEIQSGKTRVGWAENLILQLPPNHEGRNSWLINYGFSRDADTARSKWETKNGKPGEMKYDSKTKAYLYGSTDQAYLS